jgi:predicted Fe-S protein YdhL (DUF1289 family)
MKLIPNPCKSICRLNEQGICVGCRRTREEIASWSKLTNEQKQVIVKRISSAINPNT